LSAGGNSSGGGYVLERNQRIPGSLESVFPFFEDPRNLAEITPPWLRFEVVSSTDERIAEGTRIRYRIWWLGVPLRWESVISRYEPPLVFADEMTAGPYRRWIHTHTFTEVPGGVEIQDRVEYDMPAGPLGAIVHGIMVRRQLEGIFNYRAKRVEEIFGGLAQADPLPGV
jgi:ligand-binding SRPBCC domain-containing protein